MATKQSICRRWFCITSLRSGAGWWERAPPQKNNPHQPPQTSPDDAEIVEVTAAPLGAEGLLEGQHHARHVVPVPDGTEDPVPESARGGVG